MPTFQLFRIKAVQPAQLALDFTVPDDRRSLIRKVVEARPSAELRRGYRWHIGNLDVIDRSASYFAVGRTTNSTIELFDDASGNFTEELVENAPYTHVLIDFELQVLAIAAKARLAPTTAGIARALARLLNEAEDSVPGVEFKIEPLKNPVDLVREIGEAYQVTRFSVDFSLPNPWDADEDFQKPAQRLLLASEGSSGTTTLTGQDLARTPLQQLTRAAAASGDNAEATLRETENSKPVRRSLYGSNVELTESEEQEVRQLRSSVVNKMRELYHVVRGRLA